MKTTDLIGKPCSFIAPDGRELVGMITEAIETVPYGKGQIPDFVCKVRGASGRTMEVSLVESYLRTTNT